MQTLQSRRMAALAAVVALGVCACVAVVAFNTNMSLLESAMADQTKEKHTACLKECTTKDCKKACGKLVPGAAAKSAKKAAAAQKKGIMGLKKGDLDLLKDAQKARHADEVKHCKACVTAECKANCKTTLAAARKSTKVALSQKKVSLGLKTSDLKLLQDAQKRQGREEKEIKAMHAHDAKFLGKGGSNSLKATDDVNHQVSLRVPRPLLTLAHLCTGVSLGA